MSKSTTPATQALLPVTPEDVTSFLNFAFRHIRLPLLDAGDIDDIRAGLEQFRQAHPLPGDVATDAFEAGWVAARDYFQVARGIPSVDPMRRQAAEYVAALTPSALSVPVGDDIAKGLRTSQKALDKIARQEQANIAGYLALRDFPIGSASAQFPPDEVGPNALGSDSPSISAQLREISRISNKYDLRECIEGHDDALGDSYIWRDLMEQCEKLGIDPSALSGDAGEGE